jgi:mannan endo-1,4-beta-mannosidase
MIAAMCAFAAQAPVAQPAAAQSATFSVDGKVIRRNGQPFVIKGVNITGYNDDWTAYDMREDRHVNSIADCWRFNSVRLRNYINQNRNTFNSTYGYLDTVIDKMLAKGLVVILEVHDFTGKYAEGADLDKLADFYRYYANRYRGNSAVWFDIVNEPGDDQSVANKAKYLTMMRRVISVIRDEQANNNVILVAGHFWGQDAGTWNNGDVSAGNSAILSWGDEVRTFNNKTYGNIVYTMHLYDQYEFSGAARVRNYLNAIAAQNKALIIGEWGRYNNGNVDNAMANFKQVVINEGRSEGRMTWAWGGNDPNILVNGNPGYSGADINDCNAPTNLTEQGRIAWDDTHAGGSPPPPTPTAVPTAVGGGGGSSLLPNGDLESGALNPWSGWSARRVTDHKYAGAASLAIEGNQTAAQTVTGLSPNTMYRLSGYVWVNSGDAVTLGARNFGGTNVARSSSAAAWTQVVMDFTTGNSTSAEIYLSRAPAGNWSWGYADSMTLVRIGGGGGSLVINGDFETGVVTPWSGYSARVGGERYAGNHGLSVEGNQTAVQWVSGLKPNTTYRLSGYVRVNSNDTVILGARNFGGATVQRTSTSGAWTQLTMTFTTGNNNGVEIFFSRAPVGAWSWGFLDNVTLVEGN